MEIYSPCVDFPPPHHLLPSTPPRHMLRISTSTSTTTIMLTLQTFTTILAFLSFSVQASPLVQRDVVAPPIIKPDSTSVWPVGTQQTVTWDTSNLPPDSQITNPIGQIILGFNESDSLNLDFDHPLAKGFKLRDGNVTITVPDVPPRDDYLIVLFGDSGNTSPSFAITRISSPGSGTPSSASSGSISDSSAVTATSLSITGSVTTTALADSTPTSTDIITVSLPTATSPIATTTTASTGSSSSSSSAVTSASAASSSTNAGWSIHRGGSIWSSAAPFLMSMTPSVMFLWLV